MTRFAEGLRFKAPLGKTKFLICFVFVWQGRLKKKGILRKVDVRVRVVYVREHFSGTPQGGG